MKIKLTKIGQQMWVVSTDKGYLIGDNAVGVTFTDNKQEARKFTQSEAFAYKQSIADDLFDFYGCNDMAFEKY